MRWPRRNSRPSRSRLARAWALGLAVAAALSAGSAAATEQARQVPLPAPDAEAAARAYWRGRACTPLGCAPRPGSILFSVAGFALAVGVAARFRRHELDAPDDREAR